MQVHLNFHLIGDVILEDRELRRALAKASLREGWRVAAAEGLDQLSEGEIDQEIAAARRGRSAKAMPPGGPRKAG